jgi:hypothetical protein
VWGHIYRVKDGKVRFVGRGYLLKNINGNIYFDDVSGFEVRNEGRFVKKIHVKRISLTNKYTLRKKLRKYITFGKLLLSKPDLPLTTQGHMLNYPFKGRLEVIKFLQNSLFILSPIIIYMFLMCFFALLSKVKPMNMFQPFYLFHSFIWCVVFISFPKFERISYYKEPNFFWFYGIFISGIIALLAVLIKIPYFKINLRKNNLKIKTIKNLRNRNKFLSIFENRIGLIYYKAHLNLLINIFYENVLWIVLSFSIIFIFNFIYLIFINWNLNRSMHNLFWFFNIQILTMPEKILSISPILLSFLLPLLIYKISKKVSNRILISGLDFFFIY